MAGPGPGGGETTLEMVHTSWRGRRLKELLFDMLYNYEGRKVDFMFGTTSVKIFPKLSF